MTKNCAMADRTSTSERGLWRRHREAVPLPSLPYRNATAREILQPSHDTACFLHPMEIGPCRRKQTKAPGIASPDGILFGSVAAGDDFDSRPSDVREIFQQCLALCAVKRVAPRMRQDRRAGADPHLVQAGRDFLRPAVTSAADLRKSGGKFIVGGINMQADHMYRVPATPRHRNLHPADKLDSFFF